MSQTHDQVNVLSSHHTSRIPKLFIVSQRNNLVMVFLEENTILNAHNESRT